ncbi:MAG TPA: amidohydrolase family protein [Mycobacteriales bacterium]|jgi:aminocarboxymuconate-semialdehyde decarboxylase|nr:amidohydrolase family protein [Mycobacteriales bacterium]
MTVTDLHAHHIVRAALTEFRAAYPDLGPELVEREAGYYLHYPGRPALGPVPAAMFDVPARLADMAGMRVDRQVLAVPPPQLFYHVEPAAGALFARLQNDAAIDVSDRYPAQFHVFATLPLQDPAAAVQEVSRIAGSPRVRGVQIGTNVDGANLDAPELEPVWSALADADLPVWVHPDQRAIAGADRLGSYYLVNLIGNPLESTIAIACLIFGGVLQRHPRLRFGFVHGGGFAPYQTGRWDHGWGCRTEAQAGITASPTTYFGRMFFDTLTHDRDALALLGQRVGWQHVVVGSDYPFDMASAQPVSAVEALQLSPADEACVLAGNAETFLRPVPR